jgi:hypothetical protein
MNKFAGETIAPTAAHESHGALQRSTNIYKQHEKTERKGKGGKFSFFIPPVRPLLDRPAPREGELQAAALLTACSRPTGEHTKASLDHLARGR